VLLRRTDGVTYRAPADGRTTLRVRVMRPGDLEPRHLDAWTRLQLENPALDRPFLSPAYVRILGQVRADIEVAVIEQGGTIAGFFPFQRVSARTARPAGLRLSDFQGLVAAPGLGLDARALLDACGLRVWHFDHLLEEQTVFQGWHVSREISPYADLRAGYDAYLGDRRAAGVNWVSQVPRKMRKLGREVGEVRLDYDTRNPDVVKQVLTWKSLQRQRTVTDDMLRKEWVRAALDRMLATDEPGFGCVVSALYAGQRLVAGHVGLRSHRTLHLWFPAFDLDCEKYSPGLLMFCELFRAAAAAGIERVDLGRGTDRYKQSLASASTWVAEGCVDTRRLGGWFNHAWYAGRARYRNTPLADALRVPKRRLQQLIRQLAPGE